MEAEWDFDWDETVKARETKITDDFLDNIQIKLSGSAVLSPEKCKKYYTSLHRKEGLDESYCNVF